MRVPPVLVTVEVTPWLTAAATPAAVVATGEMLVLEVEVELELAVDVDGLEVLLSPGVPIRTLDAVPLVVAPALEPVEATVPVGLVTTGVTVETTGAGVWVTGVAVEPAPELDPEPLDPVVGLVFTGVTRVTGWSETGCVLSEPERVTGAAGPLVVRLTPRDDPVAEPGAAEPPARASCAAAVGVDLTTVTAAEVTAVAP